MVRRPNRLILACLLGACARSAPPSTPAPSPALPAPSAPDTVAHATPHRSPRGPVRLAFVGDINLGTTTFPNGIPADSGRAFLAGAKQFLVGDLVIGNFEGVLADSGESTKCGGNANKSAATDPSDSIAARGTPSAADTARTATSASSGAQSVGGKRSSVPRRSAATRAHPAKRKLAGRKLATD